MEHLFSPWRSTYISTFKDKPEKESGCVFCSALAGTNDNERLLVYRGTVAFVIMNLYPYNSGHMMIIPNRHTSDFESLTPEEHSECSMLLKTSIAALRELGAPHGYNIGMNLGRSAGAGIDDHLHWHIVPRWNGDTNFMPTIADVKLVSEDMTKQHLSLAASFKRLLGSASV